MRDVLLIGMMALVLAGCSLCERPSTPKEQAETEERKEEYLKNSSTRATNQELKASDEFTIPFEGL